MWHRHSCLWDCRRNCKSVLKRSDIIKRRQAARPDRRAVSIRAEYRFADRHRQSGLERSNNRRPMDFQLTDEQLQLKKSLREFAEREILPNVMKWDEANHFPLETIKELGRMGVLGMIFPAEYGGAGLGYVEYVIAIEELSRVDGSVGIIVAAHNSLCTNHIYKFGTEEQKKKYVTPLAQGTKLGCWSLTEPEAGSDAGGTRTTAVPAEGGWLLNGAKTFTTNGHYADVCVAMAVTDREVGSHGISAFILEKGMP